MAKIICHWMVLRTWLGWERDPRLNFKRRPHSRNWPWRQLDVQKEDANSGNLVEGSALLFGRGGGGFAVMCPIRNLISQVLLLFILVTSHLRLLPPLGNCRVVGGGKGMRSCWDLLANRYMGILFTMSFSGKHISFCCNGMPLFSTMKPY